MNANIEITEQEIKDLKLIRNYFGEHDITPLEHMAYAVLDRLVKKLTLSVVINRLDFKEVEMLVQLKHFEDSDYGNSEKQCAELIEKTRNKIGYTSKDVKACL